MLTIHKMQIKISQKRNNQKPKVLKKTISVYFNRCFTSTSQVIEQLINNPDNQKFKIYISHGQKNSYLQRVADYFEVEPQLKGKDYADYCLNFCIKHKIEVFVPRYHVTTLVKYSDEFKRIGVKVMFAGTSEIYQVLESKLETYKALLGTDIVDIPKNFAVTNYSEFKKAYREITEKGSSVCIKPISGIGGNGFKRILENMTEIDELYVSTGTIIAKERLERILENSQNVDPFMVMEYLEGDEYSIDCLADNGELIAAIPRRKLDNYRQNIEHQEHLLRIAQKLTRWFMLGNLYNIQVRFHKGKVYLIEINTRMSGGIHKSNLAGINFLYSAIMRLMGEILTPSKVTYRDFQIRTIENYECTFAENDVIEK